MLTATEAVHAILQGREGLQWLAPEATIPQWITMDIKTLRTFSINEIEQREWRFRPKAVVTTVWVDINSGSNIPILGTIFGQPISRWTVNGPTNLCTKAYKITVEEV